MPLTLRLTKGTALTWEEADANFSSLANGSVWASTIAASTASLTVSSLTVNPGNLTVSAGQGLFAAGAVAAPGLTVGASNTGFFRQASNARLGITIAGTYCGAIASGGLITKSTGSIFWGSDDTETPSLDLVLSRDAANTLAQRNGTNAQTNRVYRSFTNASNYSRLTQTWNNSTAVIHAEGAGTGGDGSIAFNDAFLASSAAVGFVMIPSMTGAPSGTPVDIPTGQIPICYEVTSNRLYLYNGSWRSVAVT